MRHQRDTGYAMELGTARAVVYRFLARCFSYPDSGLLEFFDSTVVEEFLESGVYLGLGTAEKIARISGWLEEYTSRQAALQELEKEYTRLFINAHPRVVVPPYSSVYLNRDRQVWGLSTAEAVRMYEAAGLGIATDFHDIPDHIAAELEFASYLIEEQQKASGDDSTPDCNLASVERKFLKEHLFKWAHVFLSRLAESSKLTFYTEIANIAMEFIACEADHLPDGNGAYTPQG